MKMNITSKVRVDQRLLDEIKTEVKETLAAEVTFTIPKKRNFCAAELWNIHKQKRQISQRRSL